jgi:hypothetical protein
MRQAFPASAQHSLGGVAFQGFYSEALSLIGAVPNATLRSLDLAGPGRGLAMALPPIRPLSAAVPYR